MFVTIQSNSELRADDARKGLAGSAPARDNPIDGGRQSHPETEREDKHEYKVDIDLLVDGNASPVSCPLRAAHVEIGWVEKDDRACG